MDGPAADESDLLDAFRTHYYQFVNQVNSVTESPTDPAVLKRLGDQITEYGDLVTQFSAVFDPTELDIISTSISAMQNRIRILYNEALDASHSGHPVIIEEVHSGTRGRPALHIDEGFLRWAYTMRSTSAIARYLGVGRRTVRNALLQYGIASPQVSPFAPAGVASDPETEDIQQLNILDNPGAIPSSDPLLDPAPSTVNNPETPPETVSYTGPLSSISDSDLDTIVQMLRSQYTRAGITILHGMLRHLGLTIPRSRIRDSLLRVDPVQRVFERIRIRRRVYSVPGPNYLWHHDGQHGLIRWGIIIHGFIDGYSRLITALRASNNNLGDTVLDLFLTAATVYGIPSRLRGDHGVENIKVAAWMEEYHGTARGSYIWGRSVHNVRIERLWVDITAQIGASWAEAFTDLELHHGLDINNTNHIWLLHTLFLPIFNDQLSFFAESWNQHTMQIRGGPNRSPLDMFGFDMLVHGVRGDDLTLEELEVYGIDWAAYQEESILRSVRGHAGDEPASSWIGQHGPPPNLSEVPVYPPPPPDIGHTNLLDGLAAAVASGEDSSIPGIWFCGLAYAHSCYNNLF